METIIQKFQGLVIIDEAYGEFSSYSLANMVKTQKNLIVVQTLSKSFGLAGLRLGYFIANKQFAEAFNKVLQYPYPLSTLTIESGIWIRPTTSLVGNPSRMASIFNPWLSSGKIRNGATLSVPEAFIPPSPMPAVSGFNSLRL